MSGNCPDCNNVVCICDLPDYEFNQEKRIKELEDEITRLKALISECAEMLNHNISSHDWILEHCRAYFQESYDKKSIKHLMKDTQKLFDKLKKELGE